MCIQWGPKSIIFHSSTQCTPLYMPPPNLLFLLPSLFPYMIFSSSHAGLGLSTFPMDVLAYSMHLLLRGLPKKWVLHFLIKYQSNGFYKGDLRLFTRWSPKYSSLFTTRGIMVPLGACALLSCLVFSLIKIKYMYIVFIYLVQFGMVMKYWCWNKMTVNIIITI